MSYLTYHDDIVGDIRIAELSDCEIIGSNLREQDALEMYNYDRSSPIQAVINSFNRSMIAMSVEHNNQVVAMFGIMIIDEVPVLWMLTTSGLKNIGRNFVRNTKSWINKMLEIYPELIGYCDLRNQESIKWLSYSGALWRETVNMGIDKMPFKKFIFRKI